MKDAVKALIKNSRGEILVLFRSHTHPSLAHDIDLPGGEVDLNESVEEALVREVAEETGLVVRSGNIKYLHDWVTLWGQRQFLYEAELGPDSDVTISWEHKSYSWMTIEEFANYSAVDEFMIESQNRLKEQTMSDDNSKKVQFTGKLRAVA